MPRILKMLSISMESGSRLHIPQYVAKEIGVINGTPVDIKIVDGSIVVKPRTYSLKELVDQVTPVRSKITGRTSRRGRYYGRSN